MEQANQIRPPSLVPYDLSKYIPTHRVVGKALLLDHPMSISQGQVPCLASSSMYKINKLNSLINHFSCVFSALFLLILMNNEKLTEENIIVIFYSVTSFFTG